MSSNYITPVQTQDAARLQGSQQVSRAPEPRKAQLLAELPELKGNDSAASGENLPLNRMDESGERTRAGQVESAVSKISDFIQNFQRDLVFTIDEESDRLVVKVVDSVTQEVIRQIPEEETLSIARHLDSPESLIISRQA
jgi:flagellar protein FlaG